jgi:hypothetical protein
MLHATRTTRHREYPKRGLLPSGTITPARHVTDRFIRMNVTEAAPYRSIEDHIGSHYDRYRLRERANRALGIIMTIYRRRLTSSFHAAKRRLPKRLEALQAADNSVAVLLDSEDFVTLENTNNETSLNITEGEFIDVVRDFSARNDMVARERSLAFAFEVVGDARVERPDATGMSSLKVFFPPQEP